MDYSSAFSLKDKVIVVVGGLGLLGREISRACCQMGAKIAICDIVQKGNIPFLVELSQSNYNFHYFEMDIQDEDSVIQTIQMISEKYSKIDSWVNLAYPRTSDWGNKLEDVKIESWNKNLEMHLSGYFITSKSIINYFMKQKSGNLINFSSIYGVLAPDFSIYEGTEMTMPVAYSAIKGGINMLSKYLSTYTKGHNIRVNVICPGGVYDNQNPEFVKRYAERVPLKRMAHPHEVVGPTLFLLSDASSYINGTILMVDGGLSAH